LLSPEFFDKLDWGNKKQARQDAAPNKFGRELSAMDSAVFPITKFICQVRSEEYSPNGIDPDPV